MMKAIKGGQRESLSEATFRYYSSLRACNRVGYSCICPVGPRNAIVHYGHPGEPNAETVDANALTLHDMGCEYHCYSAQKAQQLSRGGGRFPPHTKIIRNYGILMVLERRGGG